MLETNRDDAKKIKKNKKSNQTKAEALHQILIILFVHFCCKKLREHYSGTGKPS